jgi:LDH2 family malate/lactate/ureidoglycolate dehydrogenase
VTISPASAVITYDPERIAAFCALALERVGMARADAQILANALVTTDMRGVRTHGTLQLKGYIRQIQRGGMNPRAQFEVLAQGPSFALVDGQAGSGVVTGYKAMRLAMALAAENMIAMVGVRNSNHFGAAGYYASMCLSQDLIGFAMTNGDPTMGAPGAAARVLSNDPLAYAFPAGAQDPVMLDIAMSVVAGVKVHQAARQGKNVPPGWIVDKDGAPTTDPRAFEAGGAHVPIGGHKGFGLALMVELLAGVLTGAGVTHAARSFVAEPDKPSAIGHFFMVINPRAFMPIREFKSRVDGLAQQIKDTPRAAGVERIYVPGEMEWEREAAARTHGLELDAATLNSLVELADELGISDQGFWRGTS